MWVKYFTPGTIEAALKALYDYKNEAQIIAGGTNVMAESKFGNCNREILIDISRIPNQDSISVNEKGQLIIGFNVTHNEVINSDICRRKAFPLVQACFQIGSPQIRNRGTLVGNLVSASPAADTPPVLWVLDAFLVVQSYARGTRTVKVNDFFIDFKKVDLEPDELITKIIIPSHPAKFDASFEKLAGRRISGIAIVNTAVSLLRDENGNIITSKIAIGSVAKTVVSAQKAELYLNGKQLTKGIIRKAAELVKEDIKPIDDVRGSSDYRTSLAVELVDNALSSIFSQNFHKRVPDKVATLSMHYQANPINSCGYSHSIKDVTALELTVNGVKYSVDNPLGKTLLQVLREDIGLIGTKNGCEEGECGACTVILDGKAILSCLVPAPRAHKCNIITIEGLSENGNLHILQQEMLGNSAVQCGYCTPGILVSSYALLNEFPDAGEAEIRRALSGHLCRCTGYKKYYQAVEEAFRKFPYLIADNNQ